jgi:hypothetical protein
MSNPETTLQRKIMVAVSSMGAIPYRMQVGKFLPLNSDFPIKIGIDGTPDLLIICPNGEVLWFEIKTATGRLRKDQEQFHRVLRSLNHKVYVVRSPERAIEICKEEFGNGKQGIQRSD